MNFIKSITNWSYSFAISLFPCFPLLAAEPGAPQPYSWPWWPETHWHNCWWIFPVIFFILMILMCSLLMRRGGMACLRRPMMMKGREFPDPIKRFWGDSSASALEIINRRYANGEIDRKEYQEKKADILSST